MDCSAGDALLKASALFPQLPTDVRAIIDGSDRADNQTYLTILAKLALEPSWTSEILRCYEPLFAELVARWPSLGSTETIAAAFGRVLPLQQYLIAYAQQFLISKKSSLFTLISQISFHTTLEDLETLPTEALRELFLSIYRLVMFRREAFVQLVEPACLHHLLRHPNRVIRYLCIKIICIFLNAEELQETEMAVRYLGKEAILGTYEEKRVDYGFLVSLETKRLSELDRGLQEARKYATFMESRSSKIISQHDLSPSVANLCGVLLPRLRGPSADASSVILTSSTRVNVHHIAHALRSTQPLLITGPAGCGKTYLIHQIAQNLNELSTMVSIHLGDQTDAKLLVGAYTAGTTPGSFQWKPGVLTTAVREGRWVVVEDIDKAPTEVLSMLLPLMEKRELHIPSRGERVVAGRGFRIITTMRTATSSKGVAVHTNILGSRLWNRVDIQAPSADELRTIIDSRFPVLRVISLVLLAVYERIHALYKDPAFFSVSKTSLGRQISPRDLFKWSTRVAALFESAGMKEHAETVSDSLYDETFMEAVDCFAASVQTNNAKALVVNAIAEEMHIPPSRAGLFLAGHIPHFSNQDRSLKIGRAKIIKRSKTGLRQGDGRSQPFATTGHALRLLEQIAVAVRLAEPVLLVGETGTGKTTAVQQLADMLRHKLTVINLSQQTESGDLLGGYKPVDVRTLAVPLKDTFEELFEKTFSLKRNAHFIEMLNKCFSKHQWTRVIILWREAVKKAEDFFAMPISEQDQPKKKRRKVDTMDRPALQARWSQFAQELNILERQTSQLSKSFAFSFIEGSLVKAAREGDWVLLDEINLAAPDTLESIADLLKEGGQGNILLSEKGAVDRVIAHPGFRVFACMNPATDVGKRDLPPGIRSRFTELYVASPDGDLSNLIAVIKEYIGQLCLSDERAPADIAQLYLDIKTLADDHRLVDGAGERPHFSLRTLTRTLSYVNDITPIYGLRRSLYEGFCMSFLTLLDESSERLLIPLLEKHLLSGIKNVRSMINQIPKRPGVNPDHYVQFKHYWMHKGAYEPQDQPHYVITPFVERNMLNLVRATATKRFPVLIQGPTSSGKTSMIEYLAKRTGHRFVRINNHEHTDLQEYLGTYISDSEGRLKFQEGILVEALRKGYWIVLDELNLAPTDVLEALNRLLDDNRELLIPETQEVVRPHKDFMLFATQNPPGLYGGRKVLSRAFRNRFLELHFGDIPEEELETILKERCQIAPSYCAKIVSVYKELSILRQTSRLFETRNSFATLRDLFRWANRDAVGYQRLAENGFMLLAERVRKLDEKQVVKNVIERVMKVKVDETALYMRESIPEFQLYDVRKTSSGIVWTKAMQRLFALVAEAIRNNEPVLLVGETGCGKTSVCQMLAETFGKQLFIVNAHQNMETGDIIGAQRPVRNRAGYSSQLRDDLILLFTEHIPMARPSARGEMPLEELVTEFGLLGTDLLQRVPKELLCRIERNRAKVKALFEWNDGSLVHAMKEGQFFLLDEISLADDSVLERLNSVLESHRTIVLAEKGPDATAILARDGFQFFATMNPGGDYGKKELSPALRNRFTEIWVPAMSDVEDVSKIVSAKLIQPYQPYVSAMVSFAQWFGETYRASLATSLSIRDILSWVKFVNLYPTGDPTFGLLHGAALVFLDSLGANPSGVLTMASQDLKKEKRTCIQHLSELLGRDLYLNFIETVEVCVDETQLRVGNFNLEKGPNDGAKVAFNLQAPTTAMNAMKVGRAMQLKKPILLEGSPGVGKTSLISALAQSSGHPLVRINLSEQTDLMDLFGSDVPVEGGQSGEFMWRDAPFLQAMQRGHWVLLDEMNLASQSVLEGLNACLDHRGEAYIAELDRTFTSHPDFVVFAAQNPHHQGGGRKGLPASFVNRFTVVYVDALDMTDLQMISTHLYPSVPQDDITKLIKFIVRLDHEAAHKHSLGHQGGPWEFNLRDTLRWLELLSSHSGLTSQRSASEFVDIIVSHRFRTTQDRAYVDRLYMEIFGCVPERRHLFHQITDKYFQVGHALLHRDSILQFTSAADVTLLIQQLPAIETVMTCIEKNWPCILVGPSGCGKSSIIRLLAAITGAELDEMALNTDIDTTDIVGGFEQVDISRKASAYLLELEIFVKKWTVLAASKDHTPDSEILQLFQYTDWSNTTITDIGNLTRLASHLQLVAHRHHEFEEFFSRLESLIRDAEVVTVARFEWVDGMLVQAVQKGKWLILDNANLCNASVLDRLNSLLEPGGALIINEHSDINGEPKLIKPHPRFRLFITMDPKNGELSRAMRNRGIEIFIDPNVISEPEVIAEDERRLVCVKYSSFSAADSVASTLTFIDPPNDTTLNDFLSVSLNYLPMNQNNFLLRWMALLNTYGITGRNFSQTLVDNYLDLFSQGQLRSLMKGFFDYTAEMMGLPQDYVTAQSLHPLVNSSLLRHLHDYPPQLDPFNLAKFYDILFNIVQMGRFQDGMLERSNATRVNEPNFFERSALHKQSVTTVTRGPMQLYAFLSSIRNILRQWSIDPNLKLNKATLSFVQELVHLWWDTVKVSDKLSLEESLFHMYVVLFREWTEGAQSALPPEFVEQVQHSMAAFKGQLKLTTGMSMEIMWSRMKPSVPSTMAGWDAYAKLYAFALRFDAVAPQFHGTLEEFLTLRTSLADALSISLVSNIDPESLIKELDNHISEIEKRKQEGLAKTRASFFSQQFDQLLKCRDLSRITTLDVPRLDDITTINSHFAGRPTSSLIWYQKDKYNLHFTYEPIIQDLWRYSNIDGRNGPTVILNGQFGLSLLSTKGTVIQGTIEQIPALQSEIIALGRQLAIQTAHVTDNHISNICLLLVSKILDVLKIHKPMYNDKDYSTIEDTLIRGKSALQQGILFQGAGIIDSVLATTSNLAVNKIMKEHFIPAIHSLFFGMFATPEEKLKAAGTAWINYSRGCLKLYVPNFAIDPAMKSIIKRERFLLRRAELERKIELNQAFEFFFTGQRTNLIIQRLTSDLESLGETPPESLIARPKESQMEHLHGELSVLLRTVILGDTQDRLLESIIERRPGYKEREEVFQVNAEQIIQRLQSPSYQVYKDIIDPVIGFLYSLKLGYSLVSLDLTDWQSGSSLISSILTPTGILTETLCTSGPGETLLQRLWNLASHLQVEGPNALETIGVNAINDIMHALYRDWKIKSLKEQEETRANASTYRYRGAEEDDEESEVKKMFPDYKEDDGREEAAHNSEPKAKSNHRELAIEIAKCHSSMLLLGDNPEIGLKQLVLRGVSLCTALLNSTACVRYISPSQLEVLLPSQILSLKDSTEWLTGRRSAKSYNFYTDENLEQAQKLVTILEKLYYRIIQLVDIWPENVTLQDARDACIKVMGLPNTAPIAKFLMHIEKFHGILHEWQGVASKEFSLAEHFDSLKQLTISWRRLELQAWPRLFDVEDENCRNEAYSWWFFLYESIIDNPNMLEKSGEIITTHIGDLMSILSAFLKESTVGQFGSRVHLLRVFELHIKRLMDKNAQMQHLANAVHNLASYYEEYIPILAKRIAEVRQKMEKEIMDVTLLASWKDTNIVALRESARRSHYKLYRIVRRYRQALLEPVLPLLQGSMPESFSQSTFTNGTILDITISPTFELAQSICSAAVDNWNTRSKRLTDIPGTVKAMFKLSTLPHSIPDASEIIDNFTSNIASTIKDFQSKTPAVLTEDNKDFVKHLKSQKRKAYTDSLRTLRNMGLKYNLSRAVLTKQETLEKICVGALAPPEKEEVVVDVSDATKYFNRVLQGLPKVRDTLREHSADLTSGDVARSVGFIEHLVHLAIQQRDEIAKSSAELQSLRRIIGTYQALALRFNENDEAETELYGRDKVNVKLYKSVKRVFRWLPKLFDYVLDVLQAHASFAGLQMAEEKALLTEWRGVACDIDRHFWADKVLYDGVWDAGTKKLLDGALKAIESIMTGIAEMQVKYPHIKYLGQQIVPWLATVEDTSATSGARHRVDIAADNTTLQDLDISLQSLCNSIFVALQQVKEANSCFPATEEDPGWFLKYQSAAFTVLNNIHMGNIDKKMREHMSLLLSFPQPYTIQSSKVIRALFAAYLPIIQQYQSICHEALLRLASLHHATLKMTHILCSSAAVLGAKGFCNPQEKSEEKSNATGLEDGTGLGEGEGMEDISKDIGADEDLSELAQEKHKEEGEREIEDEKDALDIEDEMEGQMGDITEKDDGEEEDDKTEDQNNDGMEEETGEVDELDPTAVNEKMWDEIGEEDTREQQGDTKREKRQDDMEAKKENGKEGKKQEEGSEGKEEEDRKDQGEDGEEDAPPDEGDEVRKDDTGVADQHIPEVDTLDLPEDMNLDQGEKEDNEIDEDDVDMDGLSDVEDEETSGEEDKNKAEDFPELNGEEKADEDDRKIEEQKAGDGDGDMEKDQEEQETECIKDGAETPTKETEQLSEDNALQSTSDETKSAEQAAPSEAQGVDGGNDQEHDNQAASSRRDSGEEKQEHGNQDQGQSEVQSEEQASGLPSAVAQSQRSQQQSPEELPSVEKNSFRKFGDILERWHRQQREILDAQEKEHQEMDQMVLDNAEFEHLHDEDAAADTQAMGAATEEQAHSVDDSMAIDSEPQDRPLQNFEEDEEMQDQLAAIENDNTKADNQAQDHDQQDDPTVKKGYVGAMIGSRPDNQTYENSLDAMDLENGDGNDPDSTISTSLAAQTASLDLHPPSRPHSEALTLWQTYSQSVHTLSLGLTEQLRLILEPTLATKMRGDFRTGKRLNMKRIIPYIASQYKKDKIWMRRTKPSKRQYQVMICLDDSKSMAESPGCVGLAFETVALVCKALAGLEVGEIAVVGFGETAKVVHPFNMPFTGDSGVKVVEQFGFNQLKTNVLALMETSLSLFENARIQSQAPESLWQLQLIVSDGVCEDHERLKRLVRKCTKKKIMVVFVIVDAVRGGAGTTSILELNKVRFEPDGRLVMERYLDTFPFGYYLVVKDVRELPGVLAGALRQWFGEVVGASL